MHSSRGPSALGGLVYAYDANGNQTCAAGSDPATCAGGRVVAYDAADQPIWHNPGFESRIDCIWDGADPPINAAGADANNRAAAEFIRRSSDKHDAFIITAPPITGWPHKTQDPAN